MNSIVCTLFENHYHYGVAALINSLHTNEFKGDIYIGYRGELPFWATNAVEDLSISWKAAKALKITHDLDIHFLPVITDSHFTNYKPKFLLQVWEMKIKSSNLSGIFYFDPDIVNKCNWGFYERWISYGVALVHESVWNDMPYNHPKRFQWISISDDLGYKVINNLNSYINAGFIGVSKERIGFLKMWNQFIDHSALSFKLEKGKFSQSNVESDLFSVADQDLLNLTAMCTLEYISEVGPDGMGLLGVGGWLMSHATGSPKPWKISYLKYWFKGKKPSPSSRAYWENANGVIKCYSDSFVRRKMFFIRFISFLSRFYGK